MGMSRTQFWWQAGVVLCLLVLTGCAEITAALPGVKPETEDQPGPPDLAVAWLRTSPDQILMGSNQTAFSLIIANFGESEAGRSITRIRLTDAGGRDLIEAEEYETGRLGPGETHVIRSQPVHLPAELPDGTYELVIELDANSALVQSDYSNDTAVAPLDIVHPCNDKSAVIQFADPNLQRAVTSELELEGDSVTCGELYALTQLDASYCSVTSLQGLEQAFQLQWLDVAGSELQDLTPLADLESLRSLNVADNLITDLTPLADLPELELLGLAWNGVSDLTPLQHLSRLQFVFLEGNHVTDISPLLLLELTEDSSVGLHYNCLDLTEGSGTWNDLQTLISRVGHVSFEPQRDDCGETE